MYSLSHHLVPKEDGFTRVSRLKSDREESISERHSETKLQQDQIINTSFPLSYCHSCTFQLCGVMILTRSRHALRGIKLHSYFSPGFVASSDLRRGLFSPTKHHLCRIQVCSVTHGACACMFNHLRYNNVKAHHLGSQQLDQCIMMSSYVLGELDHLGLLGHIR